MKNNLLVLFPYKFTNFEFFKYELEKFNFKIKILDLSYSSKRSNKSWKSKRLSGVYAPKNFFELRNQLKSLLNKKPVVINFLDNERNAWTAYSKFMIKRKQLIEIIIRQISFTLPIKKNLRWFIDKFLEHKFNIMVYLFYLRSFFYSIFFLYLKHKNEFFFSNDKKNKRYIHNYDYSNSLNAKKKKLRKKYIIFLDSGGPYFSGDINIGYKNPNYDIKKTYNDYKNFFLKLERIFKCKIVIVPHPKYKSSGKKIKSLNPFFNDFIVDNKPEAIISRSAETLFYLSKGSLSSAYAAIFHKPIVFFYSSEHVYETHELKVIKHHAKILGTKTFDIKNFNKKQFLDKLKIKTSMYSKYFKDYLLINNKYKKKRNFQILSEFLKILLNSNKIATK